MIKKRNGTERNGEEEYFCENCGDAQIHRELGIGYDCETILECVVCGCRRMKK